jgi:hypothetical protein
LPWVIAYFLTWMASYSMVWQRQPGLIVFFMVTLFVWLTLKKTSAAAGLAVGMLWFWSTVKPQSSILVLAFVFLWCLVARSRRFVYSALLGFSVSALIALGICTLLVPTWFSSFLDGVLAYSGYHGQTGATALFGRTALATATSVLFSVFGVFIAFRALVSKNVSHFLLVVAYLLVLQAYVLQTIHYKAIMAAPICIFAITYLRSKEHPRTWGQWRAGRRFRWGLVLIAMVMVTASQYYAVLVTALPTEHGLAGVLQAMPGLSFYSALFYNMCLAVILTAILGLADLRRVEGAR